jgi:hypothetical protein
MRAFTVTAKTTSATLTAAEVLGGMITANQGGGATAAYQFPAGAALIAALPASFTTGDSFDFFATNISTNAAEIVTFTTNTDLTLVGNVTLAANNSTTTVSWAQFRVLKTGAATFSIYRVG